MANEEETAGGDVALIHREMEVVAAERLVFFSDAVMAIALTLLALDLPVPGGIENVGSVSISDMIIDARRHVDDYFAFLISFVVISAHWRIHDTFFAMIKQGYVLPWLPQARHQNSVIIEAAGAAAGRLSDIGFVVYDGVLGPWFLPTFVRAAGLAQLHYVILLPPLAVCLERVRTRSGHAFADVPVTQDMYTQFANAAVDARHLITEPHTDPAQLANLIMGRLDQGRFRYTPA